MSSCLPACFLSRANSHFPEIACCGENLAVTRSPYNKTRFDAVGPDCGTCSCSGFLLPGHLEAQRHKDICSFAGVCLSGSRISLSSTAKNSRQMQTAKLQLRPKWKTSCNMLQPLESVGKWCPHKRPTHYPTTSTLFWFSVLWCWEFQCLRAEAVEPP